MALFGYWCGQWAHAEGSGSEAPFMGAVIGLGIGGGIGSALGAISDSFSGGSYWETIHEDCVHFSVTPRRDGGIGASLALRF